jgi:NAD(P)H-dependent FMN reductase
MSGGRLWEPVRYLVFSASLHRGSLSSKLADLAAAAIEANGGHVAVALDRVE